MKSPLTAKQWRMVGDTYERGCRLPVCCAATEAAYVDQIPELHSVVMDYLVATSPPEWGAASGRRQWYHTAPRYLTYGWIYVLLEEHSRRLAPLRALYCYLLAEYVASEEETP